MYTYNARTDMEAGNSRSSDAVTCCTYGFVRSGLRNVDPGLSDLFRLYGATRTQRLTRLELPTSLPAILAGARISAGLALIGTVVFSLLVPIVDWKHLLKLSPEISGHQAMWAVWIAGVVTLLGVVTSLPKLV